MVELRLFGGVQISGPDGRNFDALARQPKRVALLAYLAATSPRAFRRRDKLLAVFWPELDVAHARNALSQALHVLRSHLAPDAIETRGDDEVRVSERVIWCDVVAFERALDEGRTREALDLQAGDLMDGFFISGAPEFDRWLEAERDRLRHRAEAAAWKLSAALGERGDTAGAIRWGRRAAGMNGPDENTARRFMTLLADSGDVVGALGYYDKLSERLRSDYDVAPSPETLALAARLRAVTSAAFEKETPAADHRRPISFDRADVANPARPTRSAVRAPVLAVLAVLAVAIVATVAFATIRIGGETPAASAMTFTLPLGDVRPVTSVAGVTLVLSPDGSRFVILGEDSLGRRLFLRPLGKRDVLALPHTEGARHPFFSPDGDSIGFELKGTLLKMHVTGGPAVAVFSDSGKAPANIQGASWGRGGRIVFALPDGLWSIQSGGGVALRLAVADTLHGEIFRWPEVLPRGQAVVFTLLRRAGPTLAWASLETGEVHSLGVEGTSPRYVEPGWLVFARMDGSLLAVRLDEQRMEVTGQPIPILDGVVVGVAGAAKVAVSRGGAIAYLAESDRSLVLVDRAGRAEPLAGPPLRSQRYGSPRVSPDGNRIAVPIAFGGQPLSNIWVLDLAQRTASGWTTDSGSFAPLWDARGGRLIFATAMPGFPPGFAVRAVEGKVGRFTELLRAAPGQFVEDVTPDGNSLVIQRRDVETGRDLFVVELQGERVVRPWLVAPGDQQAAALSPDGRWLAYTSDEQDAGRHRVYVAAFPGGSGAVSQLVGDGKEPRWSRDGSELFYRNGPRFLSARMDRARGAAVDSGRILFVDSLFITATERASYDVHPDGRHFVMVRRGPGTGEVVMLLNRLARLN